LASLIGYQFVWILFWAFQIVEIMSWEVWRSQCQNLTKEGSMLWWDILSYCLSELVGKTSIEFQLGS